MGVGEPIEDLGGIEDGLIGRVELAQLKALKALAIELAPHVHEM